MSLPLSHLLAALAIFISAIPIFTAGFISFGLARNVCIEAVDLFLGPALLSFRLRHTTLNLRLLPLGSGVKFAAHVPDPDRPDCACPPSTRGYQDIPRWERLALVCCAPAFLLAAASLTIGPAAATRAFLSFFPQFFTGALHHDTAAPAHLAAYFSSFPTHWPAAVGTLYAKFAAFNCLPTPLLIGGVAVEQLYGLLARRNLPARLLPPFALLTALPILLALFAWAVALFNFLHLPH